MCRSSVVPFVASSLFALNKQIPPPGSLKRFFARGSGSCYAETLAIDRAERLRRRGCALSRAEPDTIERSRGSLSGDPRNGGDGE